MIRNAWARFLSQGSGRTITQSINQLDLGEPRSRMKLLSHVPFVDAALHSQWAIRNTRGNFLIHTLVRTELSRPAHR
eukprot:200673-Pelagomonas_calceolata.AAC.4